MQSIAPFLRYKAKGSALIIMLMLLGVFAIILVSALKSNQQIERDKVTADALAKAKEALIGYAATYRDRHPGSVFGYLPCPAVDGNGGAAGSCGAKNVTQIGLLPWKTLGLPPLRDSSGECLWYAVSGNFKNNPNTTLMNWDTAGQLIVNDAGGATLAKGVVAVVFSPHGVIGNQDRTPGATATECSGNTNVAAYLDGNDPIYGATTVPITGAAIPAVGANTILTVATVTSIANGTNNDQGLWITSDEIFKRIKQRSDFTVDVNNLLISASTCLNVQTTLPAPITIDFSSAAVPMPETGGVIVGGVVTTGRIPQNFIDTYCSNAATGVAAWGAAWNAWWVSGTTQTGKNFNDNWQDNLLYVKCNSGQCLSVNSSPCEAALIFSGERSTTTSPAQNRATAANKNIWSNYLEGNFLSLFNGGTPTSFTGAPSTFSIVNVNTAATADIAACITPPSSAPPGSDVSFANNISSFTPAGSSAGKQVTVNNVDGTVTIYPTGASNKSGCFWYPTASVLYNKTMRAYFQFRFSNIKAKYGDGFTFTVLPGNANVAYVYGMCGDPSQTGYSGTDGGSKPPKPLPTTNLAIEYDVYQNATNDPASNHVAVLTGSLNHAAGTFSSPCDGTKAGCYPPSTPNWLVDSVFHNTRIEIASGCDSTCSSCGASGAYSLVKAWVDCTNCRDLTANFSDAPPNIMSCTSTSSWLKAGANTVEFGFTSGESSGNSQTLDLADFGVNFE